MTATRSSNQHAAANVYRLILLCGALVLILYIRHQLFFSNTSQSEASLSANEFTASSWHIAFDSMRVLTWNVAAINNNPFQFRITSNDERYTNLMLNLQKFIIDAQGNSSVVDIPVHQVFSESMFQQLMRTIRANTNWSGLEKTEQYWNTQYKDRRILTEFLQDDLLGRKRLVSMPDRITNTIAEINGKLIYRPSVINCFEGDMDSIETWWPQWLFFMFKIEISISRDVVTQTKIFQMIPQISRAKYPAVTEEEEEISKPLQTLCMAIFDAILVHMLTAVGRTTWQPWRTDMCQKLNLKKNDRTVDILSHTYGEADVQFLQEVAGNFESFAKGKLISEIFDIHRAASMDTDRDQNSFILLRKGKYKDVTEVTEKVVAHYAEHAGKKLPVVNGDLVVLTAVDKKDNTKYLLASFYGDASGLATEAVVRAVHSYSVTPDAVDYRFLMGLDANTYSNAGPMQYGVTQFGQLYRSLGLNSCFGPIPNPYRLTINSEYTIITVPPRSKDINEDKNPKDFIIFAQDQYDVVDVWRDNTGIGDFKSSILYPTIDFPSDHSIVSTVLHPKK